MNCFDKFCRRKYLIFLAHKKCLTIRSLAIERNGRKRRGFEEIKRVGIARRVAFFPLQRKKDDNKKERVTDWTKERNFLTFPPRILSPRK